MAKESFDAEIQHVKNRIADSQLRDFAVPHLVVDDVLPAELIARINDTWPDEQLFTPEVRGNHLLPLHRRTYERVPEAQLRFWQPFNELLWPHLVSAVAEAFDGPCSEVFGDLYYKHLSLDPDHPLTMMQADPNYVGHGMHHHFYHAPHWAFTMLLYVDPEDSCSQGTALHRLLPRDQSGGNETSYRLDDLDWRVQVAMDTFHWQDPAKPERVYSDQVLEYKSNRLFVFLDGPLALHSVPFDNPDGTPSPGRMRDGGRHARRRILRSHVKVHHDPFYRKHSALLPEPIDPVSFMRLMAPNAVLNADERHHWNNALRPFFTERLSAYARAAERARDVTRRQRSQSLWNQILRRSTRSAEDFRAQFVERIP